MRLRGMEAVAPERYAEAFTCRKVCESDEPPDGGRGTAMRFVPLELEGAYLVELEPHEDERGFFARTWCRDEFAEHGPRSRARPVQHLAQPARRHAARPALPARAARGDEARPLHARRDLRRDRRSPARLADPRARGSASSSTPSAARRCTSRRASRTASRRSSTTPTCST